MLADFANGPMMYQAVPNPVDFTPASLVLPVGEALPRRGEEVRLRGHHARGDARVDPQGQGRDAAAGFQFAGCDITINYFGESDYKPFVRKLQNCGAKMIFTNVVPGPVLFNFITAMHQLNYNPIFLMEAASYTTPFAQWNTAGYAQQHATSARPSYRSRRPTRCRRSSSTSTSSRPTAAACSQLGEQAVSSFLLWATAAKSCGSTLTRQCIVNYMAKVHHWTGGGLHASGDVGNNKPPQCGVMHQADRHHVVAV